ncbi:MAG: DUF86 domain-containing protein [Anaerolineaceae bacterium]|nr:DUF86 domain-containing protein [Anaerolineaceae bacterium]MCB9099656.1 DUF86 domain-containing protein [Anaerolineales bacterium]
MWDAINQIETYVDSLDYSQFEQTRLIQDGVIRQLEIIGEASRNLSDEFRDQHAELPWRQIIGLRNRLIHAYFDIDLGIIWDIVQVNIPQMKHTLSSFID